MAPAVLLLLLLSSATSLPPPRISFLLGSGDRLFFFRLPNIYNTTTLLLSNDGSTLYVGARNALLSLDISKSDVINLKKKVEWSPSQAEINSCEAKGKNQTVDCPNFVSVLQPINSTHLYACGSYAFSPRDAFIDTESLSLIQHGAAKGRCPFSPFQRSTALAIDGELFTATTSDFKGTRPQISRHFSKDGRPDVSQDLSISLLEEPTFASSALDPSDRKLYFFFSEVGKEFSFIDELRIARVAQVCKDDVGGLRTLQKKWTSFAKAPLLCQSPKQLLFNVLQDMFTLRPPEGSDVSDTLFYGVFTSQWSLEPQSAVCVFRLRDLKTAFTDSYRTFDMRTHQWSSMLGKHSYLGQCGLDGASDSELAEVKKMFLTSSSVKPHGDAPIFVSSGHQYSRVAAMRTRAANGKQYTVLFLLTETGFLHKVALFDWGVQVIEEIQVFTQPQQLKSIVLSSSKGVLYVGTSEGVAAVPVARCSVYRSCSRCVLARDPLCGWNRTSRQCSRLDNPHDNVAQFLEDGSVEEECEGHLEVPPDTEIIYSNTVVRLPCLKPSTRATLTWTSPRFKDLPDSLYIQAADGSLSFLATADTVGIYCCEAQEGHFKEVVRCYDVQQSATPRSKRPILKGEDHHGFPDKVEFYMDMTPGLSELPPSGEPEDDTRVTEGAPFTTRTNSESEDPRLGTERPDEDVKTMVKKSYYSELVVVSVLLVACVCVLVVTGVHLWTQRRAGLKVDPLVSPEDGSRTNQPLEGVPSLSSPDGPEVSMEE